MAGEFGGIIAHVRRHRLRCVDNFSLDREALPATRSVRGIRVIRFSIFDLSRRLYTLRMF